MRSSKGPPRLSIMGMLAPGNIDLAHRPIARNPDGSISTVRSMSFGTDKGEVLVPTVVGGKVVSNQKAMNTYRRTGKNLGTFKTPRAANRYAEKLHRTQDKKYGGRAILNALSGASKVGTGN